MTTDTHIQLGAHIPEDMRQTFLAQRAAYKKNRMPSLAERRADLHAIHRLLLENREALADAVNQDYGCRSRFETLFAEMLQGQETALATVRELRHWMKPRKRGLDMTQYPLASAYTFAQPVGVIGIVVPWNFPIAMTFQPLISAFAAGNRAMVKMSENSRHTARLLKTLVPRYFPHDKLAIFEDGVDGQALGPLFTQLPFDHLFFTGSPQTGKAVMANCAANLTPVTLELGGKSPCVVAPDFPLDKAAERILWAKMLNAGQICTNVDYLFLPEASVDAFVAHAQRILTKRYPDLTNGDYTAIIDQRQYDRLQETLRDAQAKGAKIVPLCPGQVGDPARRIMPPVAVLGVNESMLIMQREIFGPVLPIMTYRRKEEVADYIGDHHSPLAFYIYTHDRALQDYYLTHTISGGVSVNDALIHGALHNVPFGGVGHSGMGHYHGYEGFLTFSKLRPVFKQSRVRGLDFLMPPYKGLPSKMLNILFWRNR